MEKLGNNIDHIGPYPNSNCIMSEYEALSRLPVSNRKYFERFARVSLPDSVQIFHSSYYRNPDTRWRKAVVCTFHDSALLGGYSLGAIVRRQVIRRALTRADIIHCVSRESSMQLRMQFPEIPQERIRIVYHGVDRAIPAPINRLKLETGQFVLWVGKRLGYKNGIVTYQALTQVPDVDLVFVGGEVPLAWEKELIERLGIASRVHYLGYVSTCELAWAYVHAVAMWYTSVIEGFGMPVIEAAAYGCPAITSSAPAIQEIGGDWVIMTENPTPEWIAEATLMVSNDYTRQEIANRGKKLADRFSWDIYTQKMLDIYQELGLT
ncbi:MAG: glycosyltransferase [Candidatus Pacebacteria bacterium]|jgi:mannosyltransferase|nr:glycosyltransferase [Candidatus Paceibacterota bacterium]